MFLTEKQPPLELVVSARAVLIAQDGTVFVFEDQGLHVLPGGRREKSEPVLAALGREIREEVGCEIVGEPRPLGFFELRNEGPRPERAGIPVPAQLPCRLQSAGRTCDARAVGSERAPRQIRLAR